MIHSTPTRDRPTARERTKHNTGAADHNGPTDHDRSGPGETWVGAQAHTVRTEPSRALKQKIRRMKAEARRTEKIA